MPYSSDLLRKDQPGFNYNGYDNYPSIFDVQYNNQFTNLRGSGQQWTVPDTDENELTLESLLPLAKAVLSRLMKPPGTGTAPFPGPYNGPYVPDDRTMNYTRVDPAHAYTNNPYAPQGNLFGNVPMEDGSEPPTSSASTMSQGQPSGGNTNPIANMPQEHVDNAITTEAQSRGIILNPVVRGHMRDWLMKTWAPNYRAWAPTMPSGVGTTVRNAVINQFKNWATPSRLQFDGTVQTGSRLIGNESQNQALPDGPPLAVPDVGHSNVQMPFNTVGVNMVPAVGQSSQYVPENGSDMFGKATVIKTAGKVSGQPGGLSVISTLVDQQGPPIVPGNTVPLAATSQPVAPAGGAGGGGGGTPDPSGSDTGLETINAAILQYLNKVIDVINQNPQTQGFLTDPNYIKPIPNEDPTLLKNLQAEQKLYMTLAKAFNFPTKQSLNNMLSWTGTKIRGYKQFLSDLWFIVNSNQPYPPVQPGMSSQPLPPASTSLIPLSAQGPTITPPPSVEPIPDKETVIKLATESNALRLYFVNMINEPDGRTPYTLKNQAIQQLLNIPVEYIPRIKVYDTSGNDADPIYQAGGAGDKARTQLQSIHDMLTNGKNRLSSFMSQLQGISATGQASPYNTLKVRIINKVQNASAVNSTLVEQYAQQIHWWIELYNNAIKPPPGQQAQTYDQMIQTVVSSLQKLG